MTEAISITIEQLDNMKHAIGYKRQSVKRGVYVPYRNFYTTYAADELWEDLKKKGYAICRRNSIGKTPVIYSVSEKGLALLEDLLDIKIVTD